MTVVVASPYRHVRGMVDANEKAAPRSARCDVLIVEDDEMQAQEIAEYLERGGLVVQSAVNGSDATRMARDCPPHLALLDYNLPDTVGTDLAVEIRAIVPDLAIIVMSGRIEGLSDEMIRSHGIETFLRKPVRLSTLRQTIMTLVKAHRDGAVAH